MRVWFLIFVLMTGLLYAHDLHHKIYTQKAEVVAFSFGEEDDFSYQKYEVYAPDKKIPFAVGRTDAHSRVLFIPDQKGIWRVKVISEDGHGGVVEIEVDEHMKVHAHAQTLYEKFQKALVGIALIFMVFALLIFIKRRKD